jgi:hypothetical protein
VTSLVPEIEKQPKRKTIARKGKSNRAKRKVIARHKEENNNTKKKTLG